MIIPLYITSFFVASSIFRANFSMHFHKISNKQLKSSPTSIEVVEPGLVIIRNYLSESEQKRMAEGTLRWDSSEFKAHNEEYPLSRKLLLTSN